MKRILIASILVAVSSFSAANAAEIEGTKLPDGSTIITVEGGSNAGIFNNGFKQMTTFLCKPNNGGCTPLTSQGVASRSVVNTISDLAGSISFPLGMVFRRPDVNNMNVSGGTVSNNASTSSNGGSAIGLGGSSNSNAQGGEALGFGGNATAEGYGGYSNAQQNSGNTSNSNNATNSYNSTNSNNTANSFNPTNSNNDSSTYNDNSSYQYNDNSLNFYP